MARGRPARATVYARLNTAIRELHERLGGLPSPKEAEAIWSGIWHQEAHHSTALEGNTLVLKEVEQLLGRGRAVGAKPLKDYMEVKGYADAARWVYTHAHDPGGWSTDGLVSMAEVRHVHSLAMAPVWSVSPHEQASEREAPGQFREHDLHPFPGGMRPPSWPLVPVRVAGWVEAVNAEEERLGQPGSAIQPMPETFARLHGEFERVHPFIDGNGRAGRLLLNLILVRLGLPPIVIVKRQRDAYLSALMKADRDDYGALGEILARAMYENLNRFIVPNVAGPARTVPLAALASQDFSLAALRQAAQRGRLDAYQGPDGVWRSSREAVEDYKQRRGRRQPA